jgi:aldehyde:ferredoxin oxidoreductase
LDNHNFTDIVGVEEQFMNNGYAGKLLRINLSDGRINIEEPDELFYRRYLGGRGFSAYYLLKELPRGVDSLGPGNKLIISCGPMTGVPIAGSARHAIGSKSPATGGFGESESGGYFGAELKQAGFDIVIIEGKAPDPVYLWIKNGKAEIRDASALWGNDPADVENQIRGELGDDKIRIAQIGLAGEHLVRFAAVMNDIYHAAARMGLGAVMGSKKLKAIAVRGTNRVKPSDPETIAKWAKKIREDRGLTEGLSMFGTASVTAGHSKTGNLPVRNFQDGVFEGATNIDGQSLHDSYRVGTSGCHACFVRCDRIAGGNSRWGDIDSRYGGPEYETIGALGSCCGVDDLSAVVKGNELCNKYGLDTVSCGVTIAFAMECYERGLIDDIDTRGIDLSFGNAEAMIQMIDLIAHRGGLGDLLAEGSKRAAESFGKDAITYAMQVKGLEMPMHEPRYKKGLGLGMATNPAGPDHACSVHDTSLIYERSIEGYKGIGIHETMPSTELSPRKVAATFKYGLVRHFSNNMVMCTFLPFSLDGYREIINASTGWNMTVYEMLKVAERTLALAQIFNLREGFTESDNVFPHRMYTSQRGGPLEGEIVVPKALDEAKQLYYGMLGWDPETAIPTISRLTELDIGWALDELAH